MNFDAGLDVFAAIVPPIAGLIVGYILGVAERRRRR